MKLRNGRTPRDPKEIARGRLIGLGLMALAMIVGAVVDSRAADAYYNPDRSPLPTKPMEQAVEYAAEFAWSQYIDVGAEYAGLTGEKETADSIVVRWSYFPLPQQDAIEFNPTTTTRSANFGATVILGNARWETRNADGSLVHAVISLNIETASDSVDKCMMELLDHEFGHVFMPFAKHSDHPEDVMYWLRGDCRYSPSLSDLALVGNGKPRQSCHVELTPHGDLEYLDYNGSRISLFQWSPNRWSWQSIYSNPAPEACTGIYVVPGEVWAETWSFGAKPTVLRLKEEGALFRAIPIR